MKRTLKAIAAGMLLALAAGEAQASLAYNNGIIGRWSCNIDGRAATMVWEVRDDSRTTCSGGVCARTSGVKIVGFFWDRNGPWARLTDLNQYPNRVTFRHADGNLWGLTLSGRNASGYTTWNGRHYRLTCVRTSS
jgi:hypothetical protein